MKLKEIRQIKESTDNHYSFKVTGWDGNKVEGLEIDPFDVEITYFADDSGHVQVQSIRTLVPVHVRTENSLHINKWLDIREIHAIILGDDALNIVKTHLPNADVIKSSEIHSIHHLMNFLDNNQNDDVIIEIDDSTLKTNMEVIAALKSIMDEKTINYQSAIAQRQINFNGRLVLVTKSGKEAFNNSNLDHLADLHDDGMDLLRDKGYKTQIYPDVDKGLMLRSIHIDLSQDKTFPRGSKVQDIPGWDMKDMKHFDELARKDYRGHV